MERDKEMDNRLPVTVLSGFLGASAPLLPRFASEGATMYNELKDATR